MKANTAREIRSSIMMIEDIYDNINDYEYPYNYINREGV